MSTIVRQMKSILAGVGRAGADDAQNEKYWTTHNVTNHSRFRTAAESLDYFDWRNAQYYGYIELMPVTGQDGRTVLDFGCGPGNDLVGFSEFSQPQRLIGLDLSTSSLAEAEARLALHGKRAELLHGDAADSRIPLPDGSVDYVHSSGVVHHTADPVRVLREFHRVLRPGGRARVMVYHYDSLWVHLYVAYVKMIRDNAFPGLSLGQAFSKSTDGPNCPISRVYRSCEFQKLCEQAGFATRFLGAAVSAFELSLLPERFPAIMNSSLPAEHRRFLTSLTFDERQLPYFAGTVAGIDGCFELVKT